jgi:5-methylcytosine-specific restriction endonuclease McrA
MGMTKEHKRHSKHVTRGQRWKTMRMAILERDGFRCRECGARGRLEIDHIQPVRTHPELSFKPSNLQALCPACHTRKTRIECGHPLPDERRTEWQEAVSALEGRGKRNRAHMEMFYA